ncbi:hypothetical protein SAFG77S_01753 [Streptomyces afghaniensis]
MRSPAAACPPGSRARNASPDPSTPCATTTRTGTTSARRRPSEPRTCACFSTTSHARRAGPWMTTGGHRRVRGRATGYMRSTGGHDAALPPRRQQPERRRGTAARPEGNRRSRCNRNGEADAGKAAPAHSEKPLPTGPRRQGLESSTAYFFFPWFLTASIAAAAASGSRYVPPGFTGLKSASSS